MLSTNVRRLTITHPQVPNAPVSSRADVEAWLMTYYPRHDKEAILMLYAAEIAVNPWDAASLVFTESQYLCPTERSARWLVDASAVSNKSVFVYQLVYEPGVMALVGDIFYWYQWCPDLLPCSNMSMPFGVTHASDIPLVWSKNLLNATDRAVAAAVNDYWQNFGAYGNPNGHIPAVAPASSRLGLMQGEASGLRWPEYADGSTTMRLNITSTPATGVSGGRCAFWDRQ